MRTISPTIPAEKHYATIELEYLAIVYGVTKFRTYIWCRRVEVYTDHNPLQHLKCHQDPSKLIRWALKLQEYDLNISYRKGKAKANVDALSRLPIAETLTTLVMAIQQINNVEDFKQCVEEDDEAQQIKTDM